ncbi:DUF6448 family protein [Calditrichota bacterium LG25]
MVIHRFSSFGLSAIFLFLALFLFNSRAQAHCDAIDGPVVTAAVKALETGNVNLVLIWVNSEQEREVIDSFQKTLKVRKLSPEAQKLADTYFFETVVRLHRESEGAPYTGLKPAGRDLGPAIRAGDEAVVKGSADEVLKILTDNVKKGLHEHFHDLVSKKNFDANDVEAGREFVASYVKFIHYVDGIYKATQKSGHDHSDEAAVEAASPAKCDGH